MLYLIFKLLINFTIMKSLLIIALLLFTINGYSQKIEEKKEPLLKTKGCDFDKHTDDFTGEIIIKSPAVYNMQIEKFINKTKTSYFLILKATSSECFVNKTAVNLIFTDSSKWNKTAKITSDIVGGEFEYTALILLNDNDLQLFSTKKIWKYRLYVLDRKVNNGEAANFMGFVKCIMETK